VRAVVNEAADRHHGYRARSGRAWAEWYAGSTWHAIAAIVAFLALAARLDCVAGGLFYARPCGPLPPSRAYAARRPPARIAAVVACPFALGHSGPADVVLAPVTRRFRSPSSPV